MKLVEGHVAKRQAEFYKHAFFEENRLGGDLRGVLSFAPDLTFWVMAFQDILRLNAVLTKDTQIRRIVRHHRAEDAGHERWFLDDLAALQVPAPDVRWLFGERHSPTRDAAYALMSEVYRATDDRLRLVLVKTLESAGHVFFGRVAAAVERAGLTKSFKYFSFSHLEVEKNHQVFEDEMARYVSGIRLEPSLRAEAKQLVDRCYGAFTTMFSAICANDTRWAPSFASGFAIPGTTASAVRTRSRTPKAGVPVAAITAPRPVTVAAVTAPRALRARS
jgi:hypothetical protein